MKKAHTLLRHISYPLFTVVLIKPCQITPKVVLQDSRSSHFLLEFYKPLMGLTYLYLSPVQQPQDTLPCSVLWLALASSIGLQVTTEHGALHVLGICLSTVHVLGICLLSLKLKSWILEKYLLSDILSKDVCKFLGSVNSTLLKCKVMPYPRASDTKPTASFRSFIRYTLSCSCGWKAPERKDRASLLSSVQTDFLVLA